jgi:hypothetical protein
VFTKRRSERKSHRDAMLVFIGVLPLNSSAKEVPRLFGESRPKLGFGLLFLV